MGQKSGQLGLRHFARVAFAVETNEAHDPLAITALRSDAVVAQSHYIPDLVEEFFRLALGG